MKHEARIAGLVVVAVCVGSEPAPADGEAVVVIPGHAPRGLHGAGGERIDAAAAMLLQPRAAGVLCVRIGIAAAVELAPFHFRAIAQQHQPPADDGSRIVAFAADRVEGVGMARCGHGVLSMGGGV